MSVADFDASKYYLGTLCKRQHNYQGTGQSLRYLHGGHQCLECTALNGRRYYKENREAVSCQGRNYRAANKEKIAKRNKEYVAKNKDKVLARKANWYEKNRERLISESRKKYYANHEQTLSEAAKYREVNREKIRIQHREQSRRYYLKNKDKILVRTATYGKTELGRAARGRSRSNRRANAKQVHHVDYTKEQIAQRFRDFDNSCAYCGSKKNLSLEHFLAIARGGSNCLGNIIPACMPCNISKGASDPLFWFERQPFYSAKKWKKILKVLGKTLANYNQLPLF